MTAPNDWNTQIIQEFRANGGKVGGMFEGAPLLLLTSTGAKSGLPRTTPLMFLQEAESLFVFASKAGAHSHPDWYYNLIANPTATAEVGAESFTVRADEVTGAERARIYQAQATRFPQFAGYQANTERTIPVFVLRQS